MKLLLEIMMTGTAAATLALIVVLIVNIYRNEQNRTPD